jgi:hypothetical protein
MTIDPFRVAANATGRFGAHRMVVVFVKALSHPLE